MCARRSPSWYIKQVGRHRSIIVEKNNGLAAGTAVGQCYGIAISRATAGCVNTHLDSTGAVTVR